MNKKNFYIAKETIEGGITVEDAVFYFNNKWEMFFIDKRNYCKTFYNNYFVYEGDDVDEMANEFGEFLLLREVIQ